MINDLTGKGNISCNADVLVIGAGTVGLFVANELAAQGKHVVCLESGDRQQTADTHPLNEVEQTATSYTGATLGRARCLGGTSTRWGGALIPFQQADLHQDDFPIPWDELTQYIPEIESLFGLPCGPYEDPSVQLNADYIARLAKWPPFGKRNVFTLLQTQIERESGPTIWINATATKFGVTDGRLTSVSAESAAGDSITVTASEIIIAAGAIESTRLLMLIERQNPSTLTTKVLGLGFHDHLSAVVADLEVRDRRGLNQLVGYRFMKGGGMRNLRFELSPTSSRRNSIPPCFAHISFEEAAGGFAALRDLFRALQRRNLPDITVIAKLLQGLPWLSRAVWWRLANKRLLYPDNAQILLHMVIEQLPTNENRISLSEQFKDSFGQPRAVIHWDVGSEDLSAMTQAADALDQAWKQSSLAQLATLRRRPSDDVHQSMKTGGGIYHPGGTTKIGTEPRNGVVNSDLRVFGLKNVSICATSVLPTGGGANPTMMLFLLAKRCCTQLAKMR